MLSFHTKTLLRRTLLQNGDSAKTISYSFYVRHFSAGDSTNHRSFTISYLINSCGLSEEDAIVASNKVHLKTSTKPDSVLTLFRSSGFSETQISKIVQKLPSLLVSKTEKTLQPKFDFFVSKGLSGPELAKVILGYPFLLKESLDKSIIPSVAYLKSIVHTDDQVLRLLKCSIHFLKTDPEKVLAPNVAVLRAHGVPDTNIAKVLLKQPRALLHSPQRFKDIVEQVTKLKFDPSQYTFSIAVFCLTSMGKSTMEAKFEVYRRWGWSDVDIQSAFRKEPYCITASEKKIMRSMDYLVNTMGYDPLSFVKRPWILRRSLESGIIPRCSVFQLLIEHGLFEKDNNRLAFLILPEKEFLKRFVTKFEKEVPDLLMVYHGKAT